MENIDRGLVAMKVNNGVFLSWRVFGHEMNNAGYNLYRNGSKIASFESSDASNYTDTSGSLSSSYFIKAVVNNTEQTASPTVSVWSNIYKEIPLSRPATGINGGVYESRDCSVGDLDGDGQYEIIVKWEPSNAQDNSISGFTDITYLDAYKLDGTFLWRINLGKNIRSGAHYTQIMVYDLNSDGKSEIVCKTAPGTKDGTGAYLSGAATGTDNTADYRDVNGRILSGPEYLTVFNGLTGKEMQTIDYEPSRGNVADWGDSYGNRCDRFLACVAYLNGKTPSVVMTRGYYGKTVLVAYNWNGSVLNKLWKFDSTVNGNSAYEGQGNHNLSVADVDNDGFDEIIYGSCTIDHDGTGKYSTGLKHGDALNVGDLDPDRPGYEVWQIHEEGSANGGIGASFRDAKTGEVIFHDPANTDIGRGVSANFLPNVKGEQFWSVASSKLWSVKGNIVGTTPQNINPAFVGYWDGNEQREIINGASCNNFISGRVITFYNYGNATDVDGSKNTPCLQADILGDWREEEIYRSADYTKLILFSTTLPTARRIYTLMHDPVYRLSVAWQNVAYNQPPHTGFYIGAEMGPVPPSSVIGEKLRWSGAYDIWDVNSTPSWLLNESNSAFQQQDKVLFDQFGMNGTVTNKTINIASSLSPGEITVSSSVDYVFTGTGSITGSAKLVKNGSGDLVIKNNNAFTGATEIWDGAVILNGSSTSEVIVNGGIWGGVSTKGNSGALFGGNGTLNAGLTLNEKGAVAPGYGNGATANLKVIGDVTFNKASYMSFDISNTNTNSKDTLTIQGNLTVNDTIFLFVNLLNGNPSGGFFPLINFTGNFTGNTEIIKIVGLEGIPSNIYLTGKTIGVQIKSTRAANNIIWAGNGTEWDLAESANWQLDGFSDIFVPQDSVIFNGISYTSSEYNPPAVIGENDELVVGGIYNTTINIPFGASLPVSGMLFDAGSTNFNVKGAGSITGTGGLTKNGTGKLSISSSNSYTGKTLVNGGCLAVDHLANAGQNSTIGATTSTDPSYFELNNATLNYNSVNDSFTNRGIKLSGISDTVTVDTASLYLKGIISGDGKLVKSGAGSLVLQQQINTFTGGVVLKEGNLILGDDIANRYGMGPQSTQLTMEGGTLSLFSSDSYNNTYFHLYVPGGSNANYHADYRSDNYGNLTGAGILNMYIPYVRTSLYGDWSAFAGIINVYFKSQESSTAGDFRISNNFGYANTAVHLKDSRISLYHVNGSAVSIGELGGVTGSGLSGSDWTIGAKNTDATFNGKIFSKSLTKVGSGTLTLTDTCFYTNVTTVNAGRLYLSGNSHLKGGVSVNSSGTLEGDGSVTGAANISGVLKGNLRFGNSLTLNSSATTILTVSGFAPGQHDSISVSGQIISGGTLNVDVRAAAPMPGTKIKLINANIFSGAFSTVNCPGYTFDHSNGYLTYTGHHASGNIHFSETTIPENADLTVDEGHFLIDKSGNFSNVTLMPGAKMSLNSGKIISTPKIRIRSSQYGTASYINENEGSHTVTADVEQYLTSDRNWYISVPVANVDTSALSVAAKAIKMYHEPSSGWVSPSGNTLLPMKGYISVATKKSGLVTFNGVLNDGVQTTVLTRTYGVPKSGFHLVGNPYASYVDWDAAEKTNLESTIWLRTKNAANTAYVFDTYNALSKVGTSNNGEKINCHIPPMQAFWVRVKAPVLAHDTIGSLTFRNSMRSHKDVQIAGAIVPDINFKSPAEFIDQKVLRLVLSNQVNSDETIIVFNSDASNDLDAYDSQKMSNVNVLVPEIYTFWGSHHLAISGLKSLESVGFTIPIGIKVGQPNNYTLKSTECARFDGMGVYLRDYFTKTDIEITDSMSYNFYSDSISTSERFSIIFKPLNVVTDEDDQSEYSIGIYNYQRNQILVKFNPKMNSSANVTVFNSVGQRICSQQMLSSKLILDYNFPTGNYVVTVNSENRTLSQKITIKN